MSTSTPKVKLIPLDRFMAKQSRRHNGRNSKGHFNMKLGVRSKVDLPADFDLCKYVPFVWDQGNVGSCTANATIMMYMMRRTSLGYPSVVFSRRWLYFIERFREAYAKKHGGQLPCDWYDQIQAHGELVTNDDGADADDGIMTIIEQGVPEELSYPYIMDPEDPRVNAIPPESLKREAAKYRAKGGKNIYVDTDDGTVDGNLLNPPALLNAIKQQLFIWKRPVLVGFQCYSPEPEGPAITLDRDGVLHLPPSNWTCVGGHEATIIGWDDSKRAFLVLNSWGGDAKLSKGWGIKPPSASTNGYFYMSYNFATHMVTDKHGPYYDMANEYRTLQLPPCGGSTSPCSSLTSPTSYPKEIITSPTIQSPLIQESASAPVSPTVPASVSAAVLGSAQTVLTQVLPDVVAASGGAPTQPVFVVLVPVPAPVPAQAPQISVGVDASTPTPTNKSSNANHETVCPSSPRPVNGRVCPYNIHQHECNCSFREERLTSPLIGSEHRGHPGDTSLASIWSMDKPCTGSWSAALRSRDRDAAASFHLSQDSLNARFTNILKDAKLSPRQTHGDLLATIWPTTLSHQQTGSTSVHSQTLLSPPFERLQSPSIQSPIIRSPTNRK